MYANELFVPIVDPDQWQDEEEEDLDLESVETNYDPDLDDEEEEKLGFFFEDLDDEEYRDVMGMDSGRIESMWDWDD